LTALRTRLDTAQGPTYWRSLEEIANTEAFQTLLHNEFPNQAAAWHDAVSRRRFMQLMGASMALAGLTACTRQPEESIVPFVKDPESTVPGKPKFYATSLILGGLAQGVLVESHMGRPTKIEGNPQHPASLGAADAFGQASILSLYDPDRSQAILQAGQIRTWNTFVSNIGAALEAQRVKRGSGLRVLTETVTSPTLAHQLQALQDMFPELTWHQYEPVTQEAARAGTQLAFGQALNPVYQFDRADVILTLDADVFSAFPGALHYVRDFAAKRRVRDPQGQMNRLYSVENTPTLTGAMADHRLLLRASDMVAFGRGLAHALGALEGTMGDADNVPSPPWRQVLADDLKQHRGTSLIVAGDQQPAELHALAHLMNHALGNVGHTVVYTEPVEAHPTQPLHSLTELVDAMVAGQVELLIILGGNPVYTAPQDLNFAQHLAKVNLRVHLSLYDNETSELCNWHIPAVHDLEAWGDCRAYDGTVSLMQPLIEPLYGGKSAHELLAMLMGDASRKGDEIVKDYWQRQHGEADFTPFWRRALHDGMMSGTAFPTVDVVPQSFRPGAFTPPDPEAIELIFRPDATVWDGRFANNGWLQELPKPFSKLTWDNRGGLDLEDLGGDRPHSSGKGILAARAGLRANHALQQGFAQHLAGGPPRQVGHHLHTIGPAFRRQVPGTGRMDVGRGFARIEDRAHDDDLLERRVGRADHFDVPHPTQHIERAPDILRIDRDAAALDHGLPAPGELDEAIGVSAAEIAGVEPAIAQHVGRRLRIGQVAVHQMCAGDLEASDLPIGAGRAVLAHDAQPAVDRGAQRAAPVGRVGGPAVHRS
jgi:molybdopterin-containing oxidoreductase family iron-sulfur binding subunit